MESRPHKRRFPAPWAVQKTEHGYVVKDSNGVVLASIYGRDDLHQIKWSNYAEHLTGDEARRIAKAISRIPEFMMQTRGFYSREGGDWRWKESRPYHVALEDAYVRENWDEVRALCALNGIPFDPTGERIERGTTWTVYEFARQVDAAMFWDQFKGRWLRHDEFFYPDRPKDLPKMKPLPMRSSYGKRPPSR